MLNTMKKLWKNAGRKRRVGRNEIGGIERCEPRVYLSARVFTVPEATVATARKEVDPQVAFPADYNGPWFVTPQGEPMETLALSVKGSKVTGEFLSVGPLEGVKFKGKLGGPDNVNLVGSSKFKVVVPGIGKGKVEVRLDVSLDTPTQFFGTYETFFRGTLDYSGAVTGDKFIF
jgi:hypothetical protein